MRHYLTDAEVADKCRPLDPQQCNCSVRGWGLVCEQCRRVQRAVPFVVEERLLSPAEHGNG